MSLIEPTNTFPVIGQDFTQGLPTDLADIVGLLENTPAVQAYLGNYLAQNIITYRLFTQRMFAPNGSFAYQPTMPQAAVDLSANPTGVILPGAEFPLGQTGQSTPTVGQVSKVARKSYVTREALTAYRRNAVDTALRQLTNWYSDDVDGLGVTVLNTAIPSTGGSARVVGGTITAWSAATTYDAISGPIEEAKTGILDTRLGFRGNALVTSNANVSALRQNGAIAQILAFSRQETALTGMTYNHFFDVDIIGIPTQLCTGTPFQHGALVADLDVLGGIAEQEPLRINSIYNEANLVPSEAWVLSVAHNFAHVVLNPLAGVWINGIS